MKEPAKKFQPKRQKFHFDQTQAVLMRVTLLIFGDTLIRVIIIIFKFHPNLHNHPQLRRWPLESVSVCPWTRFTADSETFMRETSKSAHGAKIYSRQ